MVVNILFFGSTADIARTRNLDRHCEGEETVSDLLGKLTVDYPALAKYKLLIAVNEEYADPDTLLKDGDEIAVFTAVSGG
jgi:molybdopterin converting factor small subunit